MKNIPIEQNVMAEIFHWIEIICMVWFTFELISRFLTTPKPLKFMMNFLNIIDFLSILPFFLGLFLNRYYHFPKIIILKMLRALRLLKLGRYSTGMKSFAYALRISSKALFYLLALLSLNVLLFSSFVFYAEQDTPDTRFTSILAACW